MPSTTFRLTTFHGIDVRMAPSWLVVAAVIVWGYQRSFAGDQRSLATTLAMAGAVAVLFTLSVLLHEVAHAMEGRHRGVEVGGITLFLLGGATALRDPDRRAADEFAIAAVGPWSNVVLAAVFGLVAVGAGTQELDAVAEVAGLLGWLNLGLAAFNLVPGAPLDGGRVLRAAVWAVTGDRHRSTVVAAWVGVLLGLGMVGWAIWLVGWRTQLWAGAWIGVIGAYVLRSARMELTRGRLARWLAGFAARELTPATPRLAADAPVGDLVAAFRADPPAVLLDRAGEPVGVVRPEDLGEDAAGVAGDHAHALDDLPVVDASASGDRLVGLLDRQQPLVLVTDTEGTWLSSLHLIDDRIRQVRGDGVPDAPVPT